MKIPISKSELDTLNKEFRALRDKVDKLLSQILDVIRENPPEEPIDPDCWIEFDLNGDPVVLEWQGNEYNIRTDGYVTKIENLSLEDKLDLLEVLNEVVTYLLNEEEG